MKIRYEMTRRTDGASDFEPPRDLITRETRDPDVVEAVEAFNEFVLAVYGPGWTVQFVDGDLDPAN